MPHQGCYAQQRELTPVLSIPLSPSPPARAHRAPRVLHPREGCWATHQSRKPSVLTCSSSASGNSSHDASGGSTACGSQSDEQSEVTQGAQVNSTYSMMCRRVDDETLQLVEVVPSS
jgi:hypothetical protein